MVQYVLQTSPQVLVSTNSKTTNPSTEPYSVVTSGESTSSFPQELKTKNLADATA
jgi:hypothetical protein